MEQQPTPQPDPERITTIRVRLIAWCFITALLLAAPLLALRGEYGMVLFISIPLTVGMLTAFIAAMKRKRGLGELCLFTLLPASVALLGFLFIGAEGFVCILMAIPICIIPLFIGVAIGWGIQDHYWKKYIGIAIIFILNTSAYVGDRVYAEFDVVKVQQSIVIDAPPSKVWEQLTQPFEFGNADNFFLEHGVSFPQAMQLQTSGNCNSLFCTYNNGTLTGTVDSLIPERLMQFSFHEPPVSMVETSLYSEVEPNHIRGRILIDYGSFRIEPQDDGTTKLVATTQFRHNIGPQFYWTWWASYLVQQTHTHVLEKIKASAEK